jgi:uncharacterized membrane protein YbhN (UPF0104 family)
MRSVFWICARLAGGLAIVAVLVWQLGTGPFRDGLRLVGGWPLVAGFAISLLTTVCCAWRWRVVARGLGVDVPMRAAVPSYYASVFLNTALPGGVLGDVHRGIHHGRDVGAVGRNLRAVGWERAAGLAVTIGLALALLLALPSPVRGYIPVVAGGLVAGAIGVVLVAQKLPVRGSSHVSRMWRMAGTDIRDGLLTRRAWLGIVLTSAVVLAGHVATFLIAARAAGSTASTAQLLPLALLALLAMCVPTSIAGWGPREGMAAWSFGVAGLGAAQGVTTSVVYGVMVVVAALPGAVILIARTLHRRLLEDPDDATRVRSRPPVAESL